MYSTGKVRAGGALEVAKDDMDIVSAFRKRLAGKVEKERFELWFGGKTCFEVTDRTLTVVAANEFFRNFLQRHYRSAIESACLETFGPAFSVAFSILPAAGASRNGGPSQQASSAHPAQGGSCGKLASPTAASRANGHQVPAGQAGGREKRRSRPVLDFDSFVKGSTNQLARAAAEMVAGQPGEFSPLLIHGPTSVGKTHLLQAICTEARKNHRNLVAVYLSAEQFTTEFLQALRGGGLPSFRAKYRGLDLLAIDDLHFFCGKKATLVELLYTIDALTRRRRQIVFAADRAPAHLRALGGELLSRLDAGMACRIEPPGYDTRLEILRCMARRMEMPLSPDVGHFIAARLTNHARELSGALCRLHAERRATGRPITPAMAEEALAEMIRDGSPTVRLADIDRAVCDAFGLEPEALQSSRKAKSVSHPRMLAMWLARKYTRAALSEIGQYFGRRSHSTVVSAQKRVDKWIADNTTLSLAEHARPVTEAIQQVERHFRIG